MEGVSFLPALQGSPMAERAIFIEHERNRAVRDGDWKPVALRGAAWEPCNLKVDPTETHDLSKTDPEHVKTLAAAWRACPTVAGRGRGGGEWVWFG